MVSCITFPLPIRIASFAPNIHDYQSSLEKYNKMHRKGTFAGGIRINSTYFSSNLETTFMTRLQAQRVNKRLKMGSHQVLPFHLLPTLSLAWLLICFLYFNRLITTTFFNRAFFCIFSFKYGYTLCR